MENERQPGQPGTGEPGSPTPIPGTGADGNPKPPEFLTKEEFGRTAAHIRGVTESLAQLKGSSLTKEALVETLVALGIAEKAEDGTFHAKAAPTPDPKPTEKTEDENSPLFKRVRALEADLATERKKVADEQTKAAEADRNRAVIAALTKAGAINPDRDHVHLAGKVELSADKGYFARGKDVFGAEIEVPLEKAVEKYLDDNPELKKPSSKPGSGANPNPAGSRPGGRPGEIVIPKAQWEDITFMAKPEVRAKFLNGEYIRGE